eukprot:TRINITY_DN399_c0_g1_i10.p1 TRINITY_DN399_c0_g1~~TRINITY_DN399_c0_g1_i10.p1  ORF type:complete len:185 (+),score=36.55 TRINITY_DN399_c0_g1_i10:94-648(+)
MCIRDRYQRRVRGSLPSSCQLTVLPLTRYGYPYAGYGAGYAGAYAGYGGAYGYDHAAAYHPYGAYGPTLEEVKKIRESEEKAFKDAEDKRRELIEAEKKQYDEYVAAQKKAVEDAVAKEKEFYEKERELVKKLGGYPYAFNGAHGYGYPGAYGYGGAAYGAYGYGAGYGYGHPAARGYGYGYRY